LDEVEYRDEIYSAYLGEVGGAVLARVLADRQDFTADQRRKLATFSRLETRVANELETVLRRLGGTFGSTREVSAAAVARADAIAHWAMFVEQLGDRLVPYILRFERLAASAKPQDESALQLLVEHERALWYFGRDEAEGRVEKSIQHLNRLLPGECFLDLGQV